jgi:hypothetical protein
MMKMWKYIFSCWSILIQVQHMSIVNAQAAAKLQIVPGATWTAVSQSATLNKTN